MWTAAFPRRRYVAWRCGRLPLAGEEDRAPSDELNRVIWGAVKCADKPYPSARGE
jgi:hypothetical protein